MQIGKVELGNPVIAAPMAGFTDRAYRILAREFDCGLACTEMISDQALLFSNPHTLSILDCRGEPGPLCVQIFGSNPDHMARAAKIVEELGADIIDINMGCPTPRIVNNGAGAALMKNPGLAVRIVREVIKHVKVPVTAKMRKGWDENSVNAVELALQLEAEGVEALTIHGRLRSQFYSGQADWEIIRAVKEAVKIPVIGNGDVCGPLDAERMLNETGCDAVMIGRAALGNPWIFKHTVFYLNKSELLKQPSRQEKIDVALRHLRLLKETKKGKQALLSMRKHAAFYVKSWPGAAKMREKIFKACSFQEIEKILLQMA